MEKLWLRFRRCAGEKMKPGVVWVLLTVCIPQFAAEPLTTKLGFDLM